MKLKLLLCGTLLLLAGCTSSQNPIASSGEFSFTYDFTPQPVPDLNSTELDKIDQIPAAGAVVSATGGTSAASGAEYSGR